MYDPVRGLGSRPPGCRTHCVNLEIQCKLGRTSKHELSSAITCHAQADAIFGTSLGIANLNRLYRLTWHFAVLGPVVIPGCGFCISPLLEGLQCLLGMPQLELESRTAEFLAGGPSYLESPSQVRARPTTIVVQAGDRAQAASHGLDALGWALHSGPSPFNHHQRHCVQYTVQ